jgi:hypothetical protein
MLEMAAARDWTWPPRMRHTVMRSTLIRLMHSTLIRLVRSTLVRLSARMSLSTPRRNLSQPLHLTANISRHAPDPATSPLSSSLFATHRACSRYMQTAYCSYLPCALRRTLVSCLPPPFHTNPSVGRTPSLYLRLHSPMHSAATAPSSAGYNSLPATPSPLLSSPPNPCPVKVRVAGYTEGRFQHRSAGRKSRQHKLIAGGLPWEHHFRREASVCSTCWAALPAFSLSSGRFIRLRIEEMVLSDDAMHS